MGRPLTGMAKVDATITGNRSELHARGTIVGSGLTYQENGALSMTSTFDARVPDLAVDRATGEAKTEATFVTVAGQNINELTASTKYADKRITFDAEARQPERTLNAAGGVALLPEQQELRLERLALDTRGQQWQLASDTPATLRYGGNALSVEDLQLVSGDQPITAAGKVRAAGRCAASDVEQRRPGGRRRVDAAPTAVVGPAERLGLRHRLARGAAHRGDVRGIAGGIPPVQVRLADRHAQLRRRRSERRRPPAGKPHAVDYGEGLPSGRAVSRERCRRRAAKIDFAVDSSPMNLGVVQGFTTALTEVTGTFQAHLKIAGTAADPQASGKVTLDDGAATVRKPASVTPTSTERSTCSRIACTSTRSPFSTITSTRCR